MALNLPFARWRRGIIAKWPVTFARSLPAVEDTGSKDVLEKTVAAKGK